MKQGPVDLEKVARGLRAQRGGPLRARSGYFAAAELAEAVRERFRAPAGGGRATDPEWTERRLVPLAADTLEQLEQIARALSQASTPAIGPLQVAALLLERALAQVDDSTLEGLARDAKR